MRGTFGEIDYTYDDEYLILHTSAGDVMIGREELEELQDVIAGIVDDE